ncbi:MAG: hypothetical protein JWO85_3550 [Candidatus Eremiobacteraeota bacterium]|jgi:hypothetical protein|nr:hypothetical protein [Candidatus Eremiobacteraeota bacterium]
MPNVAPDRIAVVTGPISFTETDADGKPVADTVTFSIGDVIHDEALVQKLHNSGFHHALSVTEHTEHHCPADCEKATPPAAPAVKAARSSFVSTSPAPSTIAAPVDASSSIEVK